MDRWSVAIANAKLDYRKLTLTLQTFLVKTNTTNVVMYFCPGIIQRLIYEQKVLIIRVMWTIAIDNNIAK